MRPPFFFLILPFALANIQCVNFYGLETEDENLVCHWKKPPGYYLETLKSLLGVNVVRLPFSHSYVRKGNWRNMDEFVSTCDQLGIKVVFDYHRTWSSHQSKQPDAEISMADFLETWKMVLDRYKDHPSAWGVDLFNEVQHSDFSYVNSFDATAIATLEAIFPGRYVFWIGCAEWGSNCEGMFPDQNSHMWNRTFVSPHMYHWHGSDHSEWDRRIQPDRFKGHIAVGEVGWKVPTEASWGDRYLAYLENRGIYNVCFWTIAHSWDTGGLWYDDCETLEWEKFYRLQRFWGK